MKASQEIFAAALKTQLKSERAFLPANYNNSSSQSSGGGLEKKLNNLQFIDAELSPSKKNNDKISIDDQ